jgi:hypothetical protein
MISLEALHNLECPRMARTNSLLILYRHGQRALNPLAYLPLLKSVGQVAFALPDILIPSSHIAATHKCDLRYWQMYL